MNKKKALNKKRDKVLSKKRDKVLNKFKTKFYNESLRTPLSLKIKINALR